VNKPSSTEIATEIWGNLSDEDKKALAPSSGAHGVRAWAKVGWMMPDGCDQVGVVRALEKIRKQEAK
jgi:hypothetical protein